MSVRPCDGDLMTPQQTDGLLLLYMMLLIKLTFPSAGLSTDTNI